MLDNCLIAITPIESILIIEKKVNVKLSIKLLGYSGLKSKFKEFKIDISYEIMERDINSEEKFDKKNAFNVVGQMTDVSNRNEFFHSQLDLCIKKKSDNKGIERKISAKKSLVSEYQYCITVTLNFSGQEFVLTTQPFLLITQTDQYPTSVICQEWFRYFHESESEPWHKFRYFLRDYFKRETGKVLNDRQLAYLKSRFCKSILDMFKQLLYKFFSSVVQQNNAVSRYNLIRVCKISLHHLLLLYILIKTTCYS